MLEQFTWFDFFACAVPLIAAWYLWLFLVYKRSGYRIVNGLVGAAGSPVLGLEQNGGFNVDLGAAADELDLMGKSKMPDGVSRVAASDVVFAAEVDDAGESDSDLSSSVLIGDVLNELKEVFAILAKEDGSKADFFRLMVTVKESYPGLGSHPGLALLNVFVSEHAPFLLTLTELESLWD